MKNLDSLLNFLQLTHKFQLVKRAIYATNEDRMENDAEHSYQLAMAAWYVISTNRLNLDLNLVIRYSLIHDIVEAYAGDTGIFASSQDLKTKKSREKKALMQIRGEFPEFEELTKYIDEYNSKNNEESKFVSALDKLLPTLNIYLDSGRTWKKDNITIEDLVGIKTQKVSSHPATKDYFEQLLPLLYKKNQEYFKKII